MRKVLFWLHSSLALALGIFVVVIGATGSLIAFEDGLDQWTNPGLFRVQPQGEMLPPSKLLQAASAAAPGKKFPLRMPQSPSSAAIFTPRGGPQIFLNPYTGAVIGARDPNTWLTAAHQLHIRLLLGPEGKTIVAALTGILLFLVLSGIYLWWPLKRATVKWGAAARRVHFDLHNTAGIYSAAILLIAGTTGLVVHFGDDIEQSLHRSAGTAKVLKTAPSGPHTGGAKIDANEAVRAALEKLPGTKLLMISAPPDAKGSYLVALHYPEDLTSGGRSWVNVDQYNGAVLSFQDSRTVAWATRSIILNRAIHTGDIFGYFSKVLMALVCLMLISQAITGYYLWWKRVRTRQARREPVSKSAA